MSISELQVSFEAIKISAGQDTTHIMFVHHDETMRKYSAIFNVTILFLHFFIKNRLF